MFIPQRNVARWACEIRDQCHSDLTERIERGAMYRNMYLTGDENGNAVTYNKTFSYVDNLASFMFSPVDLRYRVRFHGGGNLSQREMGRTASAELQERMTDSEVYAKCSSATEWSLVKGKTFIKQLWEDGNFKPYMVQPEFMGVLLPDKNSLDDQPAFVHSSYYTPEGFAAAFRHLDNITEVMKQIGKRAGRGKDERSPEKASQLKQIILGGLNPYQAAGSTPAGSQSNMGVVNWLGGPQPNFSPKIIAQLIRLDELWVKDSRSDDWATFQLVGDVLVTGDKQLRNAFADMYDPSNPMRRLPEAFRKENPLSGMHPFVEFCPNELDGYFWGRSEICNTGVLQMQINARIDGINRLLRRQEKPPRLFSGINGLTRDKYSAMDMPGGYYVDPSPTAKMQDVYPKMPEAIWESLHEMEAMFNEMSGLPPVLRGRGESGVRSQGHAATLTQNASPRFKDRALSIERSVTKLGALSLAMLRAMDPGEMIAWLDPSTQNFIANLPSDNPALEPPAPGMKPLPFTWNDIPENAKIVVDSHSSSPIFGTEARALLFDLAKAGAVSPEELVEHTNPTGEEEILADLRRKAIAQAQMLKDHPEMLQHGGGKKGHK